MSFSLRRTAVVCLAALALTAGGAVSAAAAAPLSAPAVAQAGPGGEGGGADGFGGRHEPPMHLGPFEIPKFGSVSGGFSWGLAR